MIVSVGICNFLVLVIIGLVLVRLFIIEKFEWICKWINCGVGIIIVFFLMLKCVE